MTKPRVQRPPFCSANARESIRSYDTISARNTALSSYLQLSGGNLSGNLGIGTATANTALDVYGKVNINNISGLNTPQFGNYGGSGDRLILWNGGVSIYPFSLGMNGSTLWYSVPASSYNKFYNGGVNTLTIDSSGNLSNTGTITVTGAINANGNTIIFPGTLSDFKINLWGGAYGFGVQGSELKYTSGVNHKFYTGSTNTFTIDGTGNTSMIGNITALGSISTSGNMTASGSISNNQFSTSTNNQIVLKTINIFPAIVGSGGYYAIDVQDYAIQGYCYLHLCVSSINFFWLGKVFIMGTTLISFQNDWFLSCSTTYISNYGRLYIVIQPSTSPVFGQLMSYRIIG